MSVILAIDPGTVQSAWVLYDAEDGILSKGIEENRFLLGALREGLGTIGAVAVIEQVASYGMAVGAEVFETVFWSGKFAEALYPTPVHRITRKAVTLALCHSARAKDSNVRQALIDRFGGPLAVGRKASPGALYGISRDLWAALAVAVVWSDLNGGGS